MTGAELQVSGCSHFLPEIMREGGGEEEVTATKGPGPFPSPVSLASSPAITGPVLPPPSAQDFWASEPWGEIMRLRRGKGASSPFMEIEGKPDPPHLDFHTLPTHLVLGLA